MDSLKEHMRAALAPLENSADIEVVVERAAQLGEVFRRPLSEPGTPGETTIEDRFCLLRQINWAEDQRKSHMARALGFGNFGKVW